MTTELEIDFDFSDDLDGDLDVLAELDDEGWTGLDLAAPEPEEDEPAPPIAFLLDDPEADPDEDDNVRLGLGYRHDDHEPAPYTAGPNQRTVTG